MPQNEPKLVKREHLSISTLLDFARCPRRYFYRKSGLTPREPQTALIYGQAMHKAFPLAIEADLPTAIEAFKSVWAEELADDKRNLGNAIRSLTHFRHTHENNRSIYRLATPPDGGIELDDQTSEWEVPFALDVGLPIPLVGRIDGLVTHRDTGELWGLEFKTASRLTAGMLEAFDMHPQILAYTLALHTVTGQPIRGFMIEGMLVDKSKIDNLTHLVYVQDHLLLDISRWLYAMGRTLLVMEAESMRLEAEGKDPATPFLKDFSGCSAYPNFYIPSWRCDYDKLCTIADWRAGVGLYDVNVNVDSGFKIKEKANDVA